MESPNTKVLLTAAVFPPPDVSPQATTLPSALKAAKALSVDIMVWTVLSTTPAFTFPVVFPSTFIDSTVLK